MIMITWITSNRHVAWAAQATHCRLASHEPGQSQDVWREAVSLPGAEVLLVQLCFWLCGLMLASWPFVGFVIVTI